MPRGYFNNRDRLPLPTVEPLSDFSRLSLIYYRQALGRVLFLVTGVYLLVRY